MKIIVIENNYKGGNKSEDSTLNNADSPVIYTLPDTAFLKDHRPFFVPDFANPCTMQLHLVVRICRLGRSISERFAHRYYDAVSVGVTFTAENLLKNLREKGLPWELAKGFDGAAALGNFVPLADLDDYAQLPFCLHQGDETIQTGYGKDMTWNIDKLIAYISQFYTLKQGDFIFTGCPAIPNTAITNTNISGYIGEQKVLSFNVK